MKYIAWIVAAVVVLGALFYYFSHSTTAPVASVPAVTPIASAMYSCDKEHTIYADYFEGAPAPQPAPGEPPTPTGSVKVSLDGAATTTLAQTLSADGARYSDGNPQLSQGQAGAESLVFWNKGNTALIMRDNTMDLTYTNCTQK